MNKVKKLVSVLIVSSFVLSFSLLGTAYAKHGGDASMDMHHLHKLMNHGLAMVAEGSNMVMIAQMAMAPSIDPMTLEHGRTMIKDGKAIIERAAKGSEMQGLHKGGHGDADLMKYTHELGDAMLEVANMLEKMSMEGPTSADMMTMHHMHIMINHGLEMAAEGSDLVMLGQMGMSKDIDKFSVEHGKAMLADGRSTVNAVISGKEMKELHDKGVGADNPVMKDTHGIGNAAIKVIDLLDKMASATPMKM